MTLHARSIPLQAALARMRSFGDATSFAGSSLWYSAAADTDGTAALMPIEICTGDRSVGILILTADQADWRTGSPGQVRLAWPFQEFGYHFSPTWADRFGPTGDWVGAVHELYPSARLELRHCAPRALTSGRSDDVEAGPNTFSLLVDGDRDDWHRRLRGRYRRDFAYYRRRIERAGGSFDDLAAGDDLDTILTPCFDLHARRVAAKRQVSRYLTDRGRAFLTHLARLATEQLRISHLRLDDRIIGTCLAFVYDGHYLCFMPGWDPDYGTLDLGRQMIYHQVLREFERDLCGIDLLGGDLAYKREFGALAQPTLDVIIRPTSAARVRESFVDGAVHLYRKLVRT